MSPDSTSRLHTRETVTWARTTISAREPVEVRHHIGSVPTSEGGGCLKVDVVIQYEPNPAIGGPPLIRTAAFVELNGRALSVEETHKLRRILILAAKMLRELS